MELKDYCKNLAAELTGWKAKMYDVARKLDKMSTGEKEKVFTEVGEIHMIIEELSDRVERLQRECPTQWGPEELEMNAKSTALKLKLEEVSKTVSPSDIGG
jgi:predicted nuclease with TOPRIM domain